MWFVISWTTHARHIILLSMERVVVWHLFLIVHHWTIHALTNRDIEIIIPSFLLFSFYYYLFTEFEKERSKPHYETRLLITKNTVSIRIRPDIIDSSFCMISISVGYIWTSFLIVEPDESSTIYINQNLYELLFPSLETYACIYSSYAFRWLHLANDCMSTVMMN